MPNETSRPNIILILTDDQGAWTLRCAGNSEIKTPNLDRLAASGIRFENFFCATPVCSPARASILTGRIPSQHGIHDFIRIRQGRNPLLGKGNGRAIEYLAGQMAYTDLLAAQGYRCGLSGKWHMGDECHPQKSFTFWRVNAIGNGAYYRTPVVTESDPEPKWDTRYFTDVVTENAIEFLEQQRAAGVNFYLSVHYTAPHSPWERKHHPKDLYDDYYNNCPFESVPNEPLHADHLECAWLQPNAENRRELLSGYYAAVTAMDAGVGRILDWLEQKKLREDTLILFLSDNGMNMGHHGIYGKGNGTFPLNMYDTSVKIPAMVSRPGHVPEGVIRSELLSQVDVRPTLLEYVGIDAPEAEWLPGRSFAPLLRGEDSDGHDRVFVFDEYGPVHMLRTHEWKYVHRYPFGRHELYDLVNDPDETTNLIDEPEHADRVVELRTQMVDWFVRYVDPSVDGTHEGVTGRGQFDLAGLGAQGRKSFDDNVVLARER